jgi:carbon monoxide dehydrogenase subunit G
MQIENSFSVAAPPDRVYQYLIDVNQVVGCMPGAELSEVVDPTTFKGKVKIKVGPITVAYNGTAKIASKDDASRTATLQAEGRETTGPGSARATATMTVAESEGGSTVRIATDYTVAGRVAQFGRGVMEDVSRRLIGQMADCIKAQLETPAGSQGAMPGAPQASDAMSSAPPGEQPARAVTTAPAPAKPVNALSLFFAVLWDRLRRLFGAKPA